VVSSRSTPAHAVGERCARDRPRRALVRRSWQGELINMRTEQQAIVENRTPNERSGRWEPEHGDAGESGRETYAERSADVRLIPGLRADRGDSVERLSARSRERV
jgi:hypothetical protein